MKMSKGIAKKIALVLALALTFAVFATGCGQKQTEPSPAPGGETKTFKIGVNTWGSGVPLLDAFGDKAEYTTKLFGNTTMRASDDFTAEKETANVQSFCAAGVDGIVLAAAAVTNLLQMGDICKTAKVPFVLATFIGEKPDRDKLIENNPYYVGCIDLDMVRDGREIAQMALADGCKTAVIIGGNIGDNNMDQRSQGFREAFEAGGGKVLHEARCTDASECPTKAEDMLSAYKDVDCLYAMVGDYIPGSLSAIDKLGLKGKIKVYMSCIDKTSAEYIKEGIIQAGNDGIVLPALIAPTLLQNYLDGHPILDENGKPPHLQVHPFKVDKDNVDDYMKIFTTDGVQPLTDDMLKNLCYRYNPDVTYKDFTELLEGVTLDDLLNAHGLK